MACPSRKNLMVCRIIKDRKTKKQTNRKCIFIEMNKKMEINKVIQGDCLEKLKELPDNSVDSIVTDPPYDLVSINKRFGKEDSAPAHFGKDGSFSRLSKGFMGKTWDGTGIAFKSEMWKECFRVLKPGGHLLSFGGTRTYHRMVVAIEDAGFEIRDMIEWVYGSGFPKSLNIGKAVDKLQGNERKIIGKYLRPDGTDRDYEGWESNNKTSTVQNKAPTTAECRILTKGTSKYEGWGTALKPAHEPICMARKPLAEKTVAENCLKWGTGGINIDESRVESLDQDKIRKGGAGQPVATNFQGQTKEYTGARFPANLIHDNSEEVRECFPDTKSQGHWSKTKTTGFGEFGNGSSEYLGVGEKDKEGGNASRFFKSIIYQAKASKSERNKGCEELPIKSAGGLQGRADGSLGGEPVTAHNNHPTVKPIALMEYLIKMVTPKGGIVLDPFAGSGSTLVAAKQNGYQYIGIEMTEEYIPIINARLNATEEIIEEKEKQQTL